MSELLLEAKGKQVWRVWNHLVFDKWSPRSFLTWDLLFKSFRFYNKIFKSLSLMLVYPVFQKLCASLTYPSPLRSVAIFRRFLLIILEDLTADHWGQMQLIGHDFRKVHTWLNTAQAYEPCILEQLSSPETSTDELCYDLFPQQIRIHCGKNTSWFDPSIRSDKSKHIQLSHVSYINWIHRPYIRRAERFS